MKVRWNLQAKLFASYLAVVATGALTLLLVMALVTPLLYERMMLAMMQGMMGSSSGMMGGMMGGTGGAAEGAVTRAFMETVAYSLVLSSAFSVAVAVAVSLFVARRLVAPIRRLAGASGRIAAGHYGERVAQPSDDEVGELAESFNQMAASLEETERRRLALIGDVAHELRTPLATIEGYAEGLIDGVVEASPQTFAVLHTEADRLRRLVDDLQELSRAEAHQLSLNPRPVSPLDLVRAVQNRLARQFEDKGVALSIDATEGLPAVQADEGRAVQVLTNLLGNALRYTPAGGRVSLSVQAAGGFAEFVVADTGVGIAPEHLPHVFERFYRADRSRSRAGGGSGIGLTIARHLVEAQGGSIGAHSAGLGHGTTFTFTLPVSGKPAPTEPRQS
jgi:signal transduction histidine kinase